MKARFLRAPLAIALLGGLSVSVCSAAVCVSLVPIREVYHPGEPVAVLMTLKNSGRATVFLCMSYDFPEPSAIGLAFTYPPGVKPLIEPAVVRPPRHAPKAPVPPKDGLHTVNRLMGTVPVAPNQEYHLVIALNKYMRFEAMGRHVIGYSAQYDAIAGKDAGLPADKLMLLPAVKGQLTVVMRPGPIDEKWIRSLIAILKGPGKTPPRDAGQGKEHISREDAAELLMWADTPIVIEPLIAACKDDDMSFSSVPSDAVQSLQKFFKKYERARSGILEIAAETPTMREAIAVFDKEGVTIPGRSFKPIFASKSIINIWPALEYIRAHGTRDDVEAVEPLVNNDFSPPIAQLAAAVVKDLKARPPAKAPATPGQEKK